jgi:hypothetical protein
MRRWHAWIKEALENDGCAVTVEFVEQRVALPNTLRLLVALEHLLFTKPPDAASDLLDEAEVRTLPLGKEGARYDLDIAPTWWTVRRRFRQQRL